MPIYQLVIIFFVNEKNRKEISIIFISNFARRVSPHAFSEREKESERISRQCMTSWIVFFLVRCASFRTKSYVYDKQKKKDMILLVNYQGKSNDKTCSFCTHKSEENRSMVWASKTFSVRIIFFDALLKFFLQKIWNLYTYTFHVIGRRKVAHAAKIEKSHTIRINLLNCVDAAYGHPWPSEQVLLVHMRT